MEGKPDIPPSLEARISPSKTRGTEETQGPDWWVQRGFDLKAVIAKVYEKDPSRVAMPGALQNDDVYDFALVLPHEADGPQKNRMLQEAIEQHFHLSASVESTPEDVYVMTALAGKTPPAKTGDDVMNGGSIGWSSMAFSVTMPKGGGEPTPEMIREAQSRVGPGISRISAHNTDMAGFRGALEEGLGRPIVDETKSEGTYDFEVRGRASSNEEFFGMLRDQLGLVLTAERRNIEMLVIRLLQ